MMKKTNNKPLYKKGDTVITTDEAVIGKNRWIEVKGTVKKVYPGGRVTLYLVDFDDDIDGFSEHDGVESQKKSLWFINEADINNGKTKN